MADENLKALRKEVHDLQKRLYPNKLVGMEDGCSLEEAAAELSDI
jgi:hypothetical protein